MRMAILSTLIVIASAASIVRARATTTLPLHGYYRVGLYMPVRITGADAGGIRLSADGAMTSEVPTASGKMMLPLLALGELSNLKCSGEVVNVPLHPLSDNDRLVACSPTAAGVARGLFPTHNVIPIDLDVRDLTPNPIAWESLDAIVIDDASTFSSETIATLLTAGTTIASQTSNAPDQAWPWRREGLLWVLRSDLAGPREALAGDGAYAPTFGWRPGQSPSLRRQIMLAALILAIFAAGASLVRGRRAPLLVILVVLITMGAAEVWRRRSASPIHTARGKIVVSDRGLLATDEWTYQASPIDVDVSFPCSGLTRPIFTDHRQFGQTGMIFHLGAGNEPSFSYRLNAGTRIAFVSRTVVSSHEAMRPSNPVTSPMRSLAEEIYAGPGWEIAGEMGSETEWQTVLIKRRGE